MRNAQSAERKLRQNICDCSRADACEPRLKINGRSYETCDAHGRGGGVGRTLGVGKRRGVEVGLGVGLGVGDTVIVGVAVLVAVGVGRGVAVTVAVAVAVAVGVAVEEANSAQYLPPVF